MISMLSGNKETVKALEACHGEEISNAELDQDNGIKIYFKNGKTLHLWDDGQSCCEHRYMRTDDKLGEMKGQFFQYASIKEAPNIDDGECHEVQFLEIQTDRQTFTMSSHNEHNGYYGGFSIVALLK